MSNDRTEQYRGNGQSNAGQFGFQPHTNPGQLDLDGVSYSKRTDLGHGTHLNRSGSGVSVSQTIGPVTVNSRGGTSIKTPVKGVSIRNGHVTARRSKKIGKTLATVSGSGLTLSRRIGKHVSINSKGVLSIRVPFIGGRMRFNLLGIFR